MHAENLADPIDDLIPPPRPWWVRLLVGFVIVTIVAIGSVFWRYGFIYPRPECCGSGNGGAQMSRTDDGQAVWITTMFDNSSGRKLRISAASAELPGATVTDIALLDEPQPYPSIRTTPLPAEIAGTAPRRLAIAFVPTTCHDQQQPWGKVTVQLDVVNGWLPSIHRAYTLPNPVFDTRSGAPSVFPTDGVDTSGTTGPLAAACALLGRTGS